MSNFLAWFVPMVLLFGFVVAVTYAIDRDSKDYRVRNYVHHPSRTWDDDE